MARLNRGTISRRTVEGLPMGERETVFWDRALSGFGVRVYPSGSKVYMVQTRGGWKVEAGDHRAARAIVGGAGSAQGSGGDLGHQGGGGAKPKRFRGTIGHGAGPSSPW